jgi:beta-glucanase (GH16 family)
VPQTNFYSGDKTGSYACYRDHPENVSVSDGALQLTLRKEAAPLPCGQKNLGPSPFTAGGVMTYHLFSQAYGRFEARIKNTASSTRGLQEAFWLWPDDRQAIPVVWPAAGEIDIVETYSQYPHHAIPYLHYTYNDNGGPIPGLNTAWNCGASRGVWNTYALEWTPNRLEIFVNGKSCLVNTSGDPAFQRKYIVALTQMLGTAANSYTDNTAVPATMSVDYVHVWE